MRSIIAKLLPLAFFAVVGVVAYSTNVPTQAQLNGRDKGAGSGARRRGEWSAYGANKANTKYSPLDQIDKQNVSSLRVAWRWTSPDMEVVKQTPGLVTGKFEATPIMVNGVLYTSTSLSQVAAIDPATGRTRWVYDPESWKNEPPPNLGFLHRGVTYWTDGKEERVFIGAGDAYLIALNAKTGQPIPGFGNNGRIDLTSGLRRPVERRYYYLTSPPVICRNVLVIGSAVYDWHANDHMPPGDVRGFDVRTGKQLWTFHSIPQAGEFGNDTWLEGSWRTTGAANAWTILSADEELGYVYIPFSTPTNDYYGGHRPGDGLFGESLVCLEAKTGRRVWHFQTTHHGVWDYDLPAAPNLVDISAGGKNIKAVAQVTKQAFCFVFDRVTGKPVWPIEERKVPQSNVPGERSSPTQPFPTKPAPFDRQGFSVDDLIDFTPELRREAEAILSRYAHGPLYTPPSTESTIILPGAVGGASWAGAAFDPETGILYVPSVTIPFAGPLSKPLESDSPARFALHRLVRSGVRGPRGLFLTKPPYGRITAIDLKTGEHLWMTPMGEGPRKHPALSELSLPRLGWPLRGFPLVTRTLLLVAQEGGSAPTGQSKLIRYNSNLAPLDPALQAYDKRTGELIATVPLPNNAQGAPMTYAVGGTQYVVIAIGGGNLLAELVALALPDTGERR
jgi:quinoprotein glucose dehydrogenase